MRLVFPTAAHLLLVALAAAAASIAQALLPPLSQPSSCSRASLLQMKVEQHRPPFASSSITNGLWRSLGLLSTAVAVTMLPGPLPAPAAGGGASEGLGKINEFLMSVRQVKEVLQSEAATDLRAVQKALDVEAVTTSVDATLEAQMGRMDQTAIIAKRKVVDKVLRQVLSDVVVVEDTLREFPERTGASRMKKVSSNGSCGWVPCIHVI